MQSPNYYWDAIYGILGQRIVKSNTCPLKKSGFSINFVKTSPAENFRLPENLTPGELGRCQCRYAIAKGSSKDVCSKRASKLRNAVGNKVCRVCLEKIQKFQLFLTKTGRKSVFSISISAEILAFASVH